MTGREDVEAFLAWVDRAGTPDDVAAADADLPSPGPFVAAGDRWGGWWQDDLAPWPQDADLGPDRLAAALRQLPPGLREALVAGEVLGPAAVSAAGEREAAALLDRARQAFVAYMDEQVTGRPARREGPG